MINDANVFVFVASSNELSFVMILMNLSIMFYQENVLINFSFCDVTKFDVLSFNVAEFVTSYSCENSENVFSWNNSVEIQKNVFSSHEEQSSAKILNKIALFNVIFIREISSSSDIIFTQYKTIKKTSILNTTSKKQNKKTRSKINSKKSTKKLLKENKHKKFVVERKSFLFFFQ
jgi:hypothetical protein